MFTITTKYHGNTCRISATIYSPIFFGSGKRIKTFVDYEYDRETFENHERAAKAVIAKAGISKRGYAIMPTDKGYIFYSSSLTIELEL